MATLDELLSEESAEPASLDALLSDAPAAVVKPAQAAESPAQSIPWYRKAAMGAMDPIVGSGQLMQNIIPDKAMNVARKAAGSLAGAVGADEFAEDLARSRSTAEVNDLVRSREAEYQGERAAAGEEGLDWTRIGGTMANPLSWAGGAARAPATILQAISAGARTGALQALMQPVATEGNFVWDKGMQTALGAGVGGTLGGALRIMQPAFSWAANRVRGLFSRGQEAAAQQASQRVVDDALQAAGADPARMDPNLYSAIQREVGDALRAGMDPDPAAMARHADAAALPVPVQLTRGQATRDPMQFAWEHRVSGQEGVGEPLSALLAQQNRALIANLNDLGAGRAQQPFEVSQRIIQHIEGVDEQLRGQINQAYRAVRDSAGRPARVNTQDFVTLARDQLTGGNPNVRGLTGLADYLPDAVARQYNDIVTGRLPLTVDTVQFLDRAWGGVQRGATDDTTRNAVGALRRALNETPVQDQLGQESMQAYQAARALAAQRFQLIRDNPAYAAIEGGAARGEPDKFFQRFIAGGNVSELRNLRQLVGPENTRALQDTLVLNLRNKALNGASEENGVFSQAAYNKLMNDATQGPRIRELFADNRATLDQLYRVGRVSENLIKIPAASRVNTSNTASSTANVVRDVMRSEAGQAVSSMLPNIITGAGRVLRNAGRQVEESRAVADAVRPAVTQAPVPRQLPQAPPMRRLSDLVSRAGGGAAAAELGNDERE